jgi:hypothetical protein
MSRFAIEPPRLPLAARPCDRCERACLVRAAVPAIVFGLRLGEAWVCGPCYAALDAEARAERRGVGLPA